MTIIDGARLCATLALFALGTTRPVAAQDIAFGGQIRPRFEFRDPLITGGKAFTSMRARGQILATLDRGVSVFIQLQDVRIWGEETSTLFDFNSDGLDLHQGFVQLESSDAEFSGRAGRTELTYGGERLIGIIEWIQQAQAFDGIRLRADVDAGRVDLFGVRLANAITPEVDRDAFLVGTYGTVRNAGPGALDLYLIYNRSQNATTTSQTSFGARWLVQSGALRYRAEGTYQTGERQDLDVASFMLGGRVGWGVLDRSAWLILWYDYLSGDSDLGDGTIRVFDTLFATNHKFYGLADYFLNIPVQTRGRGLQDLAIKGSYEPQQPIHLSFELHSFHLARSAGLTTGHLGEELDLTAAYYYTKNFEIWAGLSYLFVADGFAEIGRFTEDALWTYLMLNAVF